eukprot:746285-Hanusia_phi.AAC.2
MPLRDISSLASLRLGEGRGEDLRGEDGGQEKKMLAKSASVPKNHSAGVRGGNRGWDRHQNCPLHFPVADLWAGIGAVFGVDASGAVFFNTAVGDLCLMLALTPVARFLAARVETQRRRAC